MLFASPSSPYITVLKSQIRTTTLEEIVCYRKSGLFLHSNSLYTLFDIKKRVRDWFILLFGLVFYLGKEDKSMLCHMVPLLDENQTQRLGEYSTIYVYISYIQE